MNDSGIFKTRVRYLKEKLNAWVIPCTSFYSNFKTPCMMQLYRQEFLEGGSSIRQMVWWGIWCKFLQSSNL